MTQLELLCNELLLELFEFLDTAHLIRAFFGLNYRFNQLLYTHLRDHQLSFQSISKEDFNVICQRYLPLIINQVSSLYLSDDETSNLPELLLFHGFTLDRFIHLQSLSLYNIHSMDQLNKITFQCRHLPHLIHLNIIKCYFFQLEKSTALELLNNIWSLSKLTHCNLNNIQTSKDYYYEISSISSSIQYLSIENNQCELRSLYHLFKCTPYLKRLCTTITSYNLYEQLKFIIPLMNSLKLSFRGTFITMQDLFQKMPNLNHLTIETFEIYLNGDLWKQAITNYLPMLKVFRLKMNLQFQENNCSMEEDIDQLLSTFRTAFWLVEHQWFVRCHWDPSDSLRKALVYTLPYAFNEFCYSNEFCSKSTCLDEEDYWSYGRVQIISLTNNGKTSFDSYSLLRSLHFPRIRHLDINIPFDDSFSLPFPSLHHLTSLDVFLNTDSNYYQLQTLIDQAPFLYSLKFRSIQRLHHRLFQLTSKSIRRLDLIYTPLNHSNCFTNEDCSNLISSPLGLQCEVLLIRLNNRMNTIDLIEKMSNLRLLIFKCKDDNGFFLSSSILRDELVQWLQEHFSSSYSIIRDPETFCIRVWIDRKRKEPLLLNNQIETSNYEKNFSWFLTSMKRIFW